MLDTVYIIEDGYRYILDITDSMKGAIAYLIRHKYISNITTIMTDNGYTDVETEFGENWIEELLNLDEDTFDSYFDYYHIISYPIITNKEPYW